MENFLAKLQQLLDTVIDWSLHTGVRLIVAALILFISFKLINFFAKKITKRGTNKGVDKTILRTAVYAGKIAAKCVVAVAMVGYVGIDTSAITALIASFGVCIGLAVNGALSNLAGGVLILVTRPFRVDDFIEAQGISGTVTDIHMVSTKVVTGDNKVVYLPNGALANGNIINYSEKELRRVDMEFTISNAADYEKAKELIMNTFTSHELVINEPQPFVRVASHGKDGIVIKGRAWTKNGDYWTVYFDITESLKAEFEKNGIGIPVQQINIKNV